MSETESKELAIVERPAPAPAIASDVSARLLDAWLSNLAPTTIRAYNKDFDDFARFLGLGRHEAVAAFLGNGSGNANAMALAYSSSMRERGLSPATIGRRLAALRSFVDRATTVGAIAWSLKVRGPKVETYRDTRGPGRDGVKAMVKEAEARARETPRGKRDLAILRLCYDLADRRAEVVNLDLADVDLAAKTVAILGKGRTQKRRYTLSRPAAEALADWIAARGTWNGPLFHRLDRAAGDGERQARLHPSSLNKITHAIGRRAGVPRGTNPHGLRHAAITSALELARGDIVAVQNFSRHSDPRTVMRYNDNREDQFGRLARMVGEDLG